MKLFTRFLLILVTFALVPVLAMGIWLLQSNAAARDNATQLHQQVTLLFSDIVGQAIVELNHSLGFVQDLEQAEGDSAESYKIVQRAAASHSLLSVLSIVDASGKEITRFADPLLFKEVKFYDRVNDPTVQQAIKSGRVAIGPVEMRENKPLLTLAHPLPHGQCLYVVYNLQHLWQRVKNQHLGRTGRIILLDGAGRPLPGFAEDLLERDWNASGLFSGKSGWFENLRTAGGVMVGAYNVTPSLGWWVMSLQPRSEAFVVTEGFTTKVIAFVLILMIFATVGASWISWHISRPLQVLIEGAQRTSHNDFDKPVPEIGWGEMRLLTQNFNEMMMVLKSYKEMNLEQILEEKAKVESLIHTIPDGIVLSNFHGNILYMNGTARLILGAQDFDTASKSKSIHEAFQDPKIREMVVALMRHRKRSDNVEVELKNSRGLSQGFFLCRGAAVMQGQREIGILFVLRDITIEKNLEKIKEEFFHSIVHDLRNPLASIDGFIQLMMERAATITEQNLRTYLGYIQESLNNLRQLVSDILDSAKIESGTMDLNLEPLVITTLIERLKALFLIQGERRGIGVFFEVAPDFSPPVQCDTALVQRVIMNLIGNALKFTPKGGRITLTISPADHAEVRFCVSDTGIGIPQDKLGIVFEKFKQLESGVAQRSGYGLGLSICKKIIELHGGRIWAESTPGQGSRFIFHLPIKPPVSAAPAATAA